MLHLTTIMLSESHRAQIALFLARWQDVLKKSTPIDLKKGQVLFYQGHTPCGVFVLTSGVVALYSEQNGNIEAKGELVRNQPVGIDLIYQDESYPFTGVVEQDVQGFFISKTDLQGLIGQ